MRASFWLIAFFGFIISLAGCGEFGASEKSSKKTDDSGRAEVLLKIAHASEGAGDLAAAERLYKQAVTAAEHSVAVHLELAEFYRRHHKEQLAVVALEETLKIQPENVDIARALANTNINAGAPDKALIILNKAIATHAENGLLYNSRGVALDMLGQYTQAQQSYRIALSLSPNEAITIKANLSMSYILSGSYEPAIKLLLPLLSAPDVTPYIRQNLALAYGMKGEDENALKLGLKDLPNKDAEENLKFYRLFAASHDNNKTSSSTIPVSVNDIFPENDPIENPALVNEESIPKEIVPELKPVKALAAPVSSVTTNEESPPDPVLKALPDVKPPAVKESTSIAATPLPDPILKPDEN